MTRNFLNPSEEWKTNVLGGMSPSIIMECAGKALSFWGYQMVMEMYVAQYRTHSTPVTASDQSLRVLGPTWRA